jgi:hypothetical protein
MGDLGVKDGHVRVREIAPLKSNGSPLILASAQRRQSPSGGRGRCAKKESGAPLVGPQGESGVVPADNSAYGIGARVFVSNESKAQTLGEAKLARIDDEYVAAFNRLMPHIGHLRLDRIHNGTLAEYRRARRADGVH